MIRYAGKPAAIPASEPREMLTNIGVVNDVSANERLDILECLHKAWADGKLDKALGHPGLVVAMAQEDRVRLADQYNAIVKDEHRLHKDLTDSLFAHRDTAGKLLNDGKLEIYPPESHLKDSCKNTKNRNHIVVRHRDMAEKKACVSVTVCTRDVQKNDYRLQGVSFLQATHYLDWEHLRDVAVKHGYDREAMIAMRAENEKAERAAGNEAEAAARAQAAEERSNARHMNPDEMDVNDRREIFSTLHTYVASPTPGQAYRLVQDYNELVHPDHRLQTGDDHVMITDPGIGDDLEENGMSRIYPPAEHLNSATDSFMIDCRNGGDVSAGDDIQIFHENEIDDVMFASATEHYDWWKLTNQAMEQGYEPPQALAELMSGIEVSHVAARDKAQKRSAGAKGKQARAKAPAGRNNDHGVQAG